MSSKFSSKLKRELKKSPGKAVVLAVLAAVAVWFWLPLLRNSIGNSPSKPAPTANNTTANETMTISVATTNISEVASRPQYTWRQIAKAIDADPRMKSVTSLNTQQDVFQPKVVEPPREVTELQPVAPPAVLDISPEAAGLVLSSTIVGPRMRVARVNGQSYREGDSIEALDGDVPIAYRLNSIARRSVRLTLGKKEYELAMPRKALISGPPSTVGVSSDSPDFDPAWLEQ